MEWCRYCLAEVHPTYNSVSECDACGKSICFECDKGYDFFHLCKECVKVEK